MGIPGPSVPTMYSSTTADLKSSLISFSNAVQNLNLFGSGGPSIKHVYSHIFNREDNCKCSLFWNYLFLHPKRNYQAEKVHRHRHMDDDNCQLFIKFNGMISNDGIHCLNSFTVNIRSRSSDSFYEPFSPQYWCAFPGQGITSQQLKMLVHPDYSITFQAILKRKSMMNISSEVLGATLEYCISQDFSDNGGRLIESGAKLKNTNAVIDRLSKSPPTPKSEKLICKALEEYIIKNEIDDSNADLLMKQSAGMGHVHIVKLLVSRRIGNKELGLIECIYHKASNYLDIAEILLNGGATIEKAIQYVDHYSYDVLETHGFESILDYDERLKKWQRKHKSNLNNYRTEKEKEEKKRKKEREGKEGKKKRKAEKENKRKKEIHRIF